ncbi:MAG: flagellar basal body rod C-terminal domain-containing protein, partial [Sphingopyxis granuli]
RRDAAAAARGAVSEIDLDREAADLLRFQQAYSAAARTIQVARETIQTLLSSL